MAEHDSSRYEHGDVHLGPSAGDSIEAANLGNPEDREWREWRDRAATQIDINYFSIYLHEHVVGEIFLHDINLQTKEALLGYRVFSSDTRGRGVGRQALRLLQKYVENETTLQHLAILTHRDNTASRRIAELCNFEEVGSSWEAPDLLVYAWKPCRIV